MHALLLCGLTELHGKHTHSTSNKLYEREDALESRIEIYRKEQIDQ
jgi:hypothetical protein